MLRTVSPHCSFPSQFHTNDVVENIVSLPPPWLSFAEFVRYVNVLIFACSLPPEFDWRWMALKPFSDVTQNFWHSIDIYKNDY